MKVNTGLEDYKFGQKNNWRRWAWNEATKRLKESGKSPREAIVVYLAGPQDIDRKIANEKGYDNRNLIAIDNDKNVVKSIRNKKCLAFHGGLSLFLRSWTIEPQIDIIIADFCCGITVMAIDFMDCLGNMIVNKNKVIIIANFLRGRDKYCKELIDQYYQESREYVKNLTGSDKHRGMYFLDRLCLEITIRCKRAISEYKYGEKPFITICEETGIWPEGVFNTYKSKNNSMDSVIFTWPTIKLLIPEFFPYCNKKTLTGLNKEIKEAKQQIAAIKAHRTMKFNGVHK